MRRILVATVAMTLALGTATKAETVLKLQVSAQSGTFEYKYLDENWLPWPGDFEPAIKFKHDWATR